MILGKNIIVNYEMIKPTIEEYYLINQSRLKKLFVELYQNDLRLNKVRSLNNDIQLNNYDSLTLKIVLRYNYQIILDKKDTNIYLNVDTIKLPERIFIYYNKKLIGHIVFYNNQDYLLIYNTTGSLYNFYQCLSSHDNIIYICNINLLCIIKKDDIIEGFDECLFVSKNNSVINYLVNYISDDNNKCDEDFDTGPYDFID